jgi:hypothetical protein
MTLACAVMAAAGTLLPWSVGFRWSERGIADPFGDTALVGAAALALVSLLSARHQIHDAQYVVSAAVAASICFVGCAGFWMIRVGASYCVPELFNPCLQRAQASAGWYISAVYSSLALVWMAIHAADRLRYPTGTTGSGRVGLNWPIRS